MSKHLISSTASRPSHYSERAFFQRTLPLNIPILFRVNDKSFDGTFIHLDCTGRLPLFLLFPSLGSWEEWYRREWQSWMELMHPDKRRDWRKDGIHLLTLASLVVSTYWITSLSSFGAPDWKGRDTVIRRIDTVPVSWYQWPSILQAPRIRIQAWYGRDRCWRSSPGDQRSISIEEYCRIPWMRSSSHSNWLVDAWRHLLQRATEDDYEQRLIKQQWFRFQVLYRSCDEEYGISGYR